VASSFQANEHFTSYKSGLYSSNVKTILNVKKSPVSVCNSSHLCYVINSYAHSYPVKINIYMIEIITTHKY
jgi:hypothetical protein